MKKSLFTLTLLPAMLLVACGGTKITAEEYEQKAESLEVALAAKVVDATTISQTATVKASFVTKGLSAIGEEDEKISESGKFTFTMKLETEETTVDPDEDDSELSLSENAGDYVFSVASDFAPTDLPESIQATCYSNPLRLVLKYDHETELETYTVSIHNSVTLTFDSDGVISKVQLEESTTMKGAIGEKNVSISQTLKATVTYSKLVIA